MSQLEDALRRAEKKLDEKDYAILRAVVDAYDTIAELVDDKNTTIARLAEAAFRFADREDEDGDRRRQGFGVAALGVCGGFGCRGGWRPENAAKTPPKGHGRNGADAYAGAEKVAVPHESLQPGDPCPKCDKGTVYETGRPGVLVRLVGQAPIQAKIYELQKLRCNLCGVVFTARSPDGVGAEKYDATVGSMIGLLKYGTGMPFNREEKLQGSLGIPLPASTQWDIVEAKAERIEPAFDELIRQAADGDVIFNDDTTVKILEMMGKRAEENVVAEDAAEDSAKDETSDRRGMFTSGIVSTREGHKIALFLSGHQHAGENLKDVLVRRATELPPPIQMCDALARNLPGKLQTILANCLAHGRRRFVEVADRFPEECRHVLEALSVIYHNDALAREQNLSPQQRLVFHQAESGPTMEELHVWLVRRIEDRLVEPNSALGVAISYLLRHWEKLTLFLRVAGAPLDNNVCERALKKAIRHRRNSLFYKTCHGAHVGDVFMSLIHTCELGGANPFDYLTELERHAGEVSLNPQDWMPWNYRQTLGSTAAAPATAR